jgi:hypothetical protein
MVRDILAQEFHQDGRGQHQDDLKQSFGRKYSVEGRHCTTQKKVALL